MKRQILVTAFLILLLFASCEPCPYHSHGSTDISDEGFSVSTIDKLGNLLTFQNAEWKAENGQFVVSVDYGIVDRDTAFSVHVDGMEIGTAGTPVTFSTEKTEDGRNFIFTGLPEGRHVILIAVQDPATVAGAGSLELEVEIPCSSAIKVM